MEKLKVLLMAALFWTFIIWFARTMKRKAVEEHRKFEGKMPEMEPVTEEERRYICKMLVDYTPAKNVVLVDYDFFEFAFCDHLGWENNQYGNLRRRNFGV